MGIRYIRADIARREHGSMSFLHGRERWHWQPNARLGKAQFAR
jgi:hypothetical protein